MRRYGIRRCGLATLFFSEQTLRGTHGVPHVGLDGHGCMVLGVQALLFFFSADALPRILDISTNRKRQQVAFLCACRTSHS